MNKTFKYLFCVLIIPCLVLSSNCEDLLSVLKGNNYTSSAIYIPKDLKIRSKKIDTYLKSLIKKHTGQEYIFNETDSFEKIIKIVSKHIKAENPNPSDWLERSELFLKFSNDLNDLFEAVIRKGPRGSSKKFSKFKWAKRKNALDWVKSGKYKLIQELYTFEKFQKSDFDVVPKKDFFMLKSGQTMSKIKYMKLPEYEKYVESWVHVNMKKGVKEKKNLYNKIKQGNLGIISIPDIRLIEFYNLWPMFAKDHDMKHIHWGYTHPLGLGTMMYAAKMKNPLRFRLVGGLYEGVDRVQYDFETQLNRFFAKKIGKSTVYPKIKRNMDLEEAMMTLLLSDNKTLKKMAKKVSLSNIEEEWVPKLVKNSVFSGKGISGKSLEAEIEETINKYLKVQKRAQAMREKIYGVEDFNLSKDQRIKLFMRNFQLRPEEQEVVIDGIVYKNDGRAHFNQSEDARVKLGIGDL